MKNKMKLPRNLSGQDVKLSNLLSSLFAVKGITFEQSEIYLWTEEKGERVKTFEIFERGADYCVIFCLSDMIMIMESVAIYISPQTFSISTRKRT